MENNYYQSGDSFERYDPKPPKTSRGGGRVFATVVIIIVVVLLAALVIGLFRPDLLGGEMPSKTNQPTATAAPAMPPNPAEASEIPVVPVPTPKVSEEDRKMPTLDGVLPMLPSISDNPIPNIFDAAAPGVVSVINYVNVNTGGKSKLALYGSGSGFFVSSNGYIVTNAHVVENASKVTVKLNDGDEVDAQIIGQDIETDVAVLKINRSGMPALAFGNSDEARVGEYVLAIGNPIDADQFANTLTFGIISAKSREITIDSYTNTYMQTDAAINVGNSGGPLLNMKGEVIGINSAKTITAGFDAFGNPVSAESIGFALPINQVRKVMEMLITKGQIERPGIGIVVGSVTEAMSEANGVPVGALVDSVVKDGPAAAAGIKAGDIIVEANGQKVTKQTELIELVKQLKIGDQFVLHIYREGKYMDCTIIVSNKSEMNFDAKQE